MMNEGKTKLTYDLICRVKEGDETAAEEIMDYYEPYLVKLSRIPFFNEEGKVQYRIDEDIYMNLKLTLQEAILTFQIV